MLPHTFAIKNTKGSTTRVDIRARIPAGVRETPKKTRTGDRHQRGPLGPHQVAFISGTNNESI